MNERMNELCIKLLLRSHNLNGSELEQDEGYSVWMYILSSIIYFGWYLMKFDTTLSVLKHIAICVQNITLVLH